MNWEDLGRYQPHPNIDDPIESDRCPDCGTPGHVVDRVGPIIVMGCPVCDPKIAG